MQLPLLPPIPTLHDHSTRLWHADASAALPAAGELERIILEQHHANFELWHIEDRARMPELDDHALAGTKRAIDVVNQRRNDLAEQCDVLLLSMLSLHDLPHRDAELHSESPGLMIDRLSILALKLFHTQEELLRGNAPAGHRERNAARLQTLVEQRADLYAALERLWRRVLASERRFKVYRQLKMYNDPELNPVLYRNHDR